ncbi:3D domain-containing protein [Bacillus subtilis]|uniref:3D domain-containing protein n=1 Tax=Bacillus subtilis TaxID=1423 RepID=UPI0037705D35
MKNLLLLGVMATSLGLTSAQFAQHKVEDEEIDDNSSDSPVVFNKDTRKDLPFLKNNKEMRDYNVLHRQLDDLKKREDERKRKELRKQQEERERKRVKEERRQRELAEKRAQQLAAVKAEQQRQAELAEKRKKTPVSEQPSREPQPRKPTSPATTKDTLNIEFSYYVAMCDSGCTGQTATGIDVTNTVYYQGMRIVATDPNVIPTWSVIQFDMGGQSVRAIALDTGGYIKGNKIDMLVGSVEEANRLGRQVKKVEIIRYGK